MEWTVQPVSHRLAGDGFTHLVAYFPPGDVFFPNTPPPRGVVVKAEVDRLTIRCPEWGTAYFWLSETTPFNTYLRQLPFRADRFMVAAVFVGEPMRATATGVTFLPELALWMGAPQVSINKYRDYARKDEPHRIVIPEAAVPGPGFRGFNGWDMDDFRELFPKGMPFKQFETMYYKEQ